MYWGGKKHCQIHKKNTSICIICIYISSCFSFPFNVIQEAVTYLYATIVDYWSIYKLCHRCWNNFSQLCWIKDMLKNKVKKTKTVKRKGEPEKKGERENKWRLWRESKAKWNSLRKRRWFSILISDSNVASQCDISLGLLCVKIDVG